MIKDSGKHGIELCAPHLAADPSCDLMDNQPRGDLLAASGGRVTAASPCLLTASAV